ncbi:hypothetical protein QR680_009970 [Steinernema hermaphroditum]|uniref:Uncharacterized protein n=1 Tax=Steinernema hermaphroditum TaxID=289476 RepID=A0AA39IMA6_9BILA|nr:hypothetical protein QR680_009970 [Steinernema hermaphroditum]
MFALQDGTFVIALFTGISVVILSWFQCVSKKQSSPKTTSPNGRLPTPMPSPQDGKVSRITQKEKLPTQRTQEVSEQSLKIGKSEDSFAEHKPEQKEARRAEEIVTKKSVSNYCDDYKTFSKFIMPESDFDKTMSGMQAVS